MNLKHRSKWGIRESLFLSLVVLLTAAGCSDHGDIVGVDDPPPGVDPVSFANDIQMAFNANCIGCHGAGGNAGLDLRSGVSYDNIVGVAAVNSNGDLVDSGSAESSVLYQRLSATGASPMPPSGVVASIRDMVEEWINDGALNN